MGEEIRAAGPTWQDWILAVLSGSVGSLVALLGLVLVYLLTQRAERRRATELRRSESVGQLLIAAEPMVVARMSASDEAFAAKAQACDKFAQALLRFGGREVREHPDVAWWAISWSLGFAKFALVLREGTRGDREEAEASAGTSAARMNASLLTWLEDPTHGPFRSFRTAKKVPEN